MYHCYRVLLWAADCKHCFAGFHVVKLRWAVVHRSSPIVYFVSSTVDKSRLLHRIRSSNTADRHWKLFEDVCFKEFGFRKFRARPS